MPQECPFCQLISNPEQLLVVGETDNFYAWLEINPRAKGHTMVVPKEHKDTVMDFSPSEYQEAMGLAREVVEKAEEGLGADGASITINIDESGGQMVPHAYIQVFPRFEDEENAGTPTGAIFPQREDLREQLEDIQSEMESVDVSFGEAVEPHPESQRFKEEPSQEPGSEPSKKEKRTVSRDEIEKELESSTEDSGSEKEETEIEHEEEDGDEHGHWDGKSYSWQ